ncbi:MAG: class III lanthionine synthetase LanKC [Actinomycetota bacterium]|nr:class III lanthionine synthetase LanKC [Actinomycetota bacterium]
MDTEYELYCLADSVFYDSAILHAADDADFALARGPVPDGWDRLTTDDWVEYGPKDLDLPSQGWKIHASATTDSAEEILQAVWDYCIPRRIAFKFIRSQDLLFLRNAKYANRGISGKFVTIYPADESQLGEILRDLGESINGLPGPYILSDLRWGDGPLFVRYGGFFERHCVGANGAPEPAIEDERGELVPDRRGATFYCPPWVTLPECLAPHLAARNSASVDAMPYRIDRALHFSNGGGVYGGVARTTDEPVVVKEARPYAGLALDGEDAVVRLGRERDMLNLLAGLDVPAFHDYFTMAEHHFLVMEFVEGESLNAHLVKRSPATLRESDRAAIEDYTAWALGVQDRLERAVAAVHERGVILNDLHPSNVLIRPDGRVALIDLETAWKEGEDRVQTMADAGFLAPPGCRGYDIDRYALACLRLFAFLPLTDLLALDPGKARHLADEIAELFPVPPDYLDEAVHTITAAHAPRLKASSVARPESRLEPDTTGWHDARESMTRAILASASPERNDRLFPGDIKQFAPGGGLNLAHGAAGVLYALAMTGAGRHPHMEEWLVRRAMEPQPGTSPGFYDGLHGIAYVLDHLDRRDDALALLELCNREFGGKLEKLGLNLYSGLAGIGLTLEHFAATTADSSLWETTLRVADMVADGLGDEDSVGEISGGAHPYAGLTRGSSGPALLFLRLYERFGDTTLLDLAATAIRQDLRRCVVRDDSNTMEVNEGWRTMPYLADGSVGIGVVLDDYLAYREDTQFAEAAASIRRAADYAFYIYPGLLTGRAGMLLHHARSRAAGIPDLDDAIADHVRRLAWHAVPYEGHLAYPGERLLRLSMDLATGTAGVLLALGAALHEDPVHLPFLAPLPARRHPEVPNQPLTMERG